MKVNAIRQGAVALVALLSLVSHAGAETPEPPAASESSGTGVAAKVEKAVVRGVRAAASGVEYGVRAAASGVERGAKAAAHGVTRGAKATADAASHVANKISGESAASPASGK